MRRKRFKKLSRKQFHEIQKLNWKPVKLIGNTIPDFLMSAPEGLIHSVYASGTVISEHLYNEPLVLGNHIGGIEVYRNAPDDPVNLNKDLYAVFANTEDDLMLLVCGPVKDKEHWIDEIPDRLNGVDVLLPPDSNEEGEA
jgi:hypothetical protein